MKTERQSNSVCLKYWQRVLIPQAATPGQVHCPQTLNAPRCFSIPCHFSQNTHNNPQPKTKQTSKTSTAPLLSIRIAGDRMF